MKEPIPLALKPGDRLDVLTPILDPDGREAIAVPGDRVWVITVQATGMRVRCPEAGLDTWFRTTDTRFALAARTTTPEENPA